MKRGLFPWLIVLARSWGISNDQACHFVGVKLAKTPSVCDERTGMCTLLSFAPSQGLFGSSAFPFMSGPSEPVSCADAVQFTRQLLLSHEIENSSPVDPTNLRETLLTLVNEEFYFLLIGNQALSTEALARMLTISDYVMSLVCKEWALRDEFVFRVGVDALRAFNSRMSELIHKSIRSPHSADSHKNSLSPILYFLADLAAVFPEHFPIRLEELRPLAVQLIGHRPQYRNAIDGELVAAVESPGTDIRALALMNAFRDLSSLAHSLSRGQKVRANEDHLTSLEWAMSIGDRSKSATRMLLYAIHTRICPSVTAIMELLIKSVDLAPYIILKTGVSLVQECQPHVKMWHVLRASIALGRLDSDTADQPRLVVPMHGSLEDILSALGDDSYPWINGARFGSMDDDDINDVLYDVASPDIFPRYGNTNLYRFPIDSSEVSLAIDFGVLLKTLGRLIGLTIRASLFVRFIHLHPDVLRILWNPSRIRASFLQLGDFGNNDRYLEVIRSVRQGMVDVLGPAAFQCFPTDENFITWFPHPPANPPVPIF